MGFNPFKAVGKAVKGITKPFKKVLRSPIGKVAGLAALYYGAPAMFPNAFGGSAGGAGWKKFIMGAAGNEGYAAPGQAIFKPGVPSLLQRFKDMGTLGKAATIGAGTMAAGAMGDDVLEESKTVVDTSGHEGYLNARKGFVDEWTEWLINQGHDEDTARAMAEKELFTANEGGIVGLAQGGRIGMFKGAEADARAHKGAMSPGTGTTGRGRGLGDTDDAKAQHIQDQYKAKVPNLGAPPGMSTSPTYVHQPKTLTDRFTDFKNKYIYNPSLKRNKVLALRKMNLMPGTNPFSSKVPQWAEDLTEDELTDIAISGPYLNLQKSKWDASKLGQGKNLLGRVFEGQNLVDKDQMTQTAWENLFPGPTPIQEGEGPQADWLRLGYPSHAAYLAAMQGGGGGGGVTPTNTTGDYYGFDEWADWSGAPTTPLFGDATQYKALLNKGGRIGLYAGGMGVMNNPMNPMMNRGLGAMGSPGMNPFNQQNLMAQGQMRGNPMMGGNPMMARGNPMMGQRPGIPAQGPGISGTQAAAKMAKKEDDGELLKLIRMLASMGIPMEQLRGRTKEELVEMAISLQKDQPTGRPEVVEESEEVEEVVEAAQGGRIHAAEGYPNPEEEYIDVSGEAGTRYLRENAPGLLGEMYSEEEEEVVIPKAGGGLMRTRYAMGSEQPVIPSKDGPQIDYRDMGGYQPHGKKEKHDDVRALLAQGEFVVTSDAVKGIGGGDRDLGAKRMYDMMHKYEPIGRALS